MKNIFLSVGVAFHLIAVNPSGYGVNVFLDYEDEEDGNRCICVDFRNVDITFPENKREEEKQERILKINNKTAFNFEETTEEKDFFKSTDSEIFATWIRQSQWFGSLLFLGIDHNDQLESVKSMFAFLASRTDLWNKMEKLSITFDGAFEKQAKSAAKEIFAPLESIGIVIQ